MREGSARRAALAPQRDAPPRPACGWQGAPLPGRPPCRVRYACLAVRACAALAALALAVAHTLLAPLCACV